MAACDADSLAASSVLTLDDQAPAELSGHDLDTLLMIRQFELLLLELFAAGHVSGTTHTCIGQEYIPVAMAPLLDRAFVVSNHRCHGHYLAQFGDAEGLLAEILGRSGGVCNGHGGSQHLYREGFCSTGVQGEGVPIALGAAMSMKRTGAGGLAAAYIGDGTWGQGAVYEALNMAQLWQAPLVVLVENNGIAQSTPTDRAMAGRVADRAAAFGLRYARVTQTGPAAIRGQLASQIELTRSGGGPFVAEFITTRVGPHSKGDDTRPPEQRRAAEEADWLAGYRRHYGDQVRAAELAQQSRLRRLAAEILARPLAGASPS
jgi:acetoin:2,6-dichlorophenolindophenol oxidoreductase subunit alpha